MKDLKPGRILDTLVAQYVMDYSAGHLWWVSERYANPADIPCYSTDMTAAFQVVETITLFKECDTFAYEIRDLIIKENGYLNSHYHTILYVKPFHICLAALKAKGVTEI